MSRWLTKALDLWAQIWFRPESLLPLDVMRIGLGIGIFVGYALLAPNLFELWGDNGWVNRASVQLYIDSLWHQSVFFFFSEPWQWQAFYAAFLFSCLAFTFGWRSNLFKWVVLIGHTSFAYRNPLITYGVDAILSAVLFLICLAPLGRHLSISARNKYDIDQKEMDRRSRGFAIRRLLQIQMAVFFLFSGIEKLQGASWWSGDALWYALNNYEYTNIPIDWLANHYWLANVLAYGAVIGEIGYFFLIWSHRTRPYFLCLAIALHLGIGIMMGLYYFSYIMIVCHLCFVRNEWYEYLATRFFARQQFAR